MKIYVLTDGDYSDYKIIAMFSSAEKRSEYAKIYGYNEKYSSEEYDLDPDFPQELKNGFTYFQVSMWSNGDVLGVYEMNRYHDDKWYQDDKEITYKPTSYNKGKIQGHELPDICYTFSMWAKDEKHAIKIANERRIMKLAFPLPDIAKTT